MARFYGLASKQELKYAVAGTTVALMESIANPAATIIIGKMWRDIERLVKGELSPSSFLHRGEIYGLCLMGIAFYSALMNCLGYTLWGTVGFKLGHLLRSSLFRSLVQRQSSWFSEKGDLEGETVSYFKDIQDVEAGLGVVSYELITMTAGCIVEIGVAFYFSWAVTLVCLAGLPVLFVIGATFSSPIVNAVLVSKTILDSISLRVAWVFNSLLTVKVLQKEMYEQSIVHDGLARLRKSKLRYWLLTTSQQALCRTVALLIFVQGFYFGSYMVKYHGLSAGNVVTVFWCCLNASALLQAVMGHLIEWNKAKASAKRLSNILSVDEEQELFDSIGLVPEFTDEMLARLQALGWMSSDDDSSATDSYSEGSIKTRPPILSRSIPLHQELNPQFMDESSHKDMQLSPRFGDIELTDVVFSYPDRHDVVLAGLSMSIEAGKTTFVIGKSGSGKSTLSSLLSKQYTWQAGEVTINGHDVHLLSKAWIESNVYICEQNSNLFNISIKENIVIGSRAPMKVTNEEIEQAIEDSCADFVWELPEKLNSVGVDKLSGGQQQRIALARARIRDAPIMIYDEVTSALDSQLQTNVISKILSYRQNCTTIIITHDLSIIPEGHTVYKIENGLAERFSDISELQLPKSIHFRDLPKYHSIQLDPIKSNYTPFELADQPGLSKSPLTVTSKFVSTASSKVKINKGGCILELIKSVPDRGLLFLGLLVSSVHAVINPIFSFVFSKLITAVVDPNAKHTTKWAMLVVMLAILDGCATFAKFILNVTTERWLSMVSEKIFNNVVNSMEYNIGREQASYYTKLLVSDAERCGEVLSSYLPGILSMVIIGLVGFITSIAFGWKLSLVGISLLPVFIAVSRTYKSFVTRKNRLRESKRSRVVRLLMELTSGKGNHTLKVQHLENYFKHLYLKAEKELDSMTRPMLLQLGMGYGVLKCFPYSLEALVLWYGIHLIGTKEYTIQQTMTVFSLLMFTIVTIDQLTTTIGRVGVGFEALKRLQTAYIENKPKNCKDKAHLPLESRLSSENKPDWDQIDFYLVGKTYENGMDILGGFTESIKATETVAITGPSGIGKSAIARMLLCLETPSTGEIVIDRKWDLEQIGVFDIRQNIGLVNQAPLAAFEGTIEEAIMYGLNGCEKATAKMIEISKLTGAHDFIIKLNDGYETRIKAGHLSGGQMQLLAIVRVLIREPRVLILDECTASLDNQSKEVIKKMLVSLKDKRRMIIIIITHHADVAEIADRIIRLG